MVAWAPVPNAWPGSITRSSAASARRLPRRADGEPVAEHQRAVELAPALGPVVGDLRGRHLDQRAAGRRAQVGQRGSSPGGAVDRVLDDASPSVDLLDAARRELEQLGEHELGVCRAARGWPGGSPRRLAAEGAPELPEHALVGAQVVLGQRVSRAARAARAARGSRWRGMTTLTTTRRSPVPPAAQRRHPCAAQRSASRAAGCPAGISSSTRPVERRHLDRRCRAPPAAPRRRPRSRGRRRRGRSAGPRARGPARTGRRRDRRARRRGRGRRSGSAARRRSRPGRRP